MSLKYTLSLADDNYKITFLQSFGWLSDVEAGSGGGKVAPFYCGVRDYDSLW
jgi:hypothetical protein